MWRDHFVQGGSSLDRAGEEAESTVEVENFSQGHVRPLSPRLLAKWRAWREHFFATGSWFERAGEEADATVEGIYLGTGVYDRSPTLEAPPSRGTGFVAEASSRPTPPSATLPPFRWGDVVPLPPSGPVSTSAVGARPLDGEPRPNGPTDVGGTAGGWRAA